MADHRVLVSYDVQPITCYGCNDTGHLYHACSMRQRLQGTASISTPTSWADRAARTGNALQAGEDEEGIARHSGQPELVDKNYKEHCASHPLDGRSDQVDRNVQVDVTMMAAKCGIETPSISAQPVQGPESNVVVRVDSSAAEMGERRDAVLLSLQLAHQETPNIPQTDMGITEVGQERQR